VKESGGGGGGECNGVGLPGRPLWVWFADGGGSSTLSSSVVAVGWLDGGWRIMDRGGAGCSRPIAAGAGAELCGATLG
jgi:hypothetical protein